MMQSDNFKITNLSLDERVLFINAFDITLETYLKNYGLSVLNICIDEHDYEKKLKLYSEYLEKRKKGYSVASIVKKKDFYKSTFYVDENVLIPRPETETLVEYITENFIKNAYHSGKTTLNILDMCTGSGCIGISLLEEAISHNIHINLTMVDISKKALNVAKINYDKLIKNNIKFNNYNIKNMVNFVESDLFEKISKINKYDLIVSNPPYVTAKDYECVDIEVKNEPKIALVGGEDGLDIIRRLIEDANEYLKTNGVLMLEFGVGEETEIKMLLEKSYKDVKIINDLTNRPRFAYASKV